MHPTGNVLYPPTLVYDLFGSTLRFKLDQTGSFRAMKTAGCMTSKQGCIVKLLQDDFHTAAFKLHTQLEGEKMAPIPRMENLCSNLSRIDLGYHARYER